VNGTVEVRDSPSQYDSTNADGVAQWSFYVPEGNIESIEADVHYDGSRTLWSAQRTIIVGGTNPLMAVLIFFLGTVTGRLVVGSIALLGIVVAAYNRRVKPKKRAAKLSLENQLQMFVDLESLRHFMAVYLDRGTCVFYHPFTDERIQPDLISGFIAAITSVYGEIKGDGVRGTLEEIQYHGLRLNSYSGDKIIGILILEGEMTPLLKDRLQFFVELFENQYEKDLDGWSGLVDCFDSEWIVSTLNSAFNYAWLLPHRFGPTQKVSKTDAKILDYISAVRDQRGEFFIRKLLAPLSEMLELSEAEVLDRLLTLQDRGAIVPVGVQTVLQRQGMGLSDGQDEDVVTVALPHVPETEEEVVEEPQQVKIDESAVQPAEVVRKFTPEIKEEVAEEPQQAKIDEPAVQPAEVVEKPAPETKEKRRAKLKVMADEPAPKPEPEKEIDPMEAFVRDVESLLVAKEKEKSEKESDEEE
jgi:DNA-binding Lrp family transcriptional regulator